MFEMTIRMNLLLMIFTVILDLSVFTNTVWGERWIAYGRSEKTTFFYDRESMKKYRGQVRVWIKYIVSTDTKEYSDCLKYSDNYKKCNSYREYRNQYEIKCRDDLVRRIYVIVYGENGDILYSDNSKEEWSGIPPDSVIEGLKNKVCK